MLVRPSISESMIRADNAACAQNVNFGTFWQWLITNQWTISELPKASVWKLGYRCKAVYTIENDFLIIMQIKLILTRKILYLASFWEREFLELGNSNSVVKMSFYKASKDSFHVTSRRPFWSTEQWNGGHVAVPRKSWVDGIHFSWKSFISFNKFV